jgi:hypothetical protein
VSWITLAELKKRADEEDKQRAAEAEANAEHLAERNAEIRCGSPGADRCIPTDLLAPSAISSTLVIYLSVRS